MSGGGTWSPSVKSWRAGEGTRKGALAHWEGRAGKRASDTIGAKKSPAGDKPAGCGGGF